MRLNCFEAINFSIRIYISQEMVHTLSNLAYFFINYANYRYFYLNFQNKIEYNGLDTATE